MRVLLAPALTLIGAVLTIAAPAAPPRPEGPCDIYGKAGTPCVAAHSTTRAMSASYNGPLYQIKRQSDGRTLDIGIGAGGIVVRWAWVNMRVFLRWNGFAEASELLLNALDLIPRGPALLCIQVHDGGPGQPALSAIHNRGHHLQVT